MAGDPTSAVLLMGLGVETLSMAASCIPPVKRALRTFSLERARRLAAEALAAEDVSEVHHLIDAAFEESGLGGASSAEIRIH